MSCTFDKEKLTAYFDGELDAAEKGDVEKHISSCSECLRELGEIKSAAQLVRTLPRLKAPVSVAQAVAKEIAPVRRIDSIARYRRWIAGTFAAAAVFLVVANILYFFGGSRSPEQAPSVAGLPARIPVHEEVAKAADPGAEAPRDGALRRARALDRPADDALPAQESKPAPAEKNAGGGTSDERRNAAESLLKRSQSQEQAAQEPARGAAGPAAAKAAPAKALPVPRTEDEAADRLAKKDAVPPPAPPGAPAPVNRARPESQRELEMAKNPDKGGSDKPVGALQDKLGAQGGPSIVRFSVGSPQPQSTRAKAEAILATLGVVQDRSRKEAAAPTGSTSLVVEMTPSQFEELKRQLEGDPGVRLRSVETEEEASRLRAAVASEGVAKAPQGGLAGGAGSGAKPEAGGKFGAGPTDDKKTASPRAEEDQKAGEAGAKAKDAKTAATPDLPAPGGPGGAKGLAEGARRYVFIFTTPPSEKK